MSTKILEHINIGTASLPETYNRAIIALKECNSIDECKEWSDKMAALASYWKQVDDNRLEKLARGLE